MAEAAPHLESETSYELAIVGGGIAGCMLGAAMARNGVKVAIIESATYPKFAIGESMILETSELMRSLALVFDVPELEHFSAENYLPVIGGSHGVKRHFSYLPHQRGKQSCPGDVLQAVIPQRPYGHELHIHRQDSDYYFATVAVRYGATLLQNTPVTDIVTDADGVRIHISAGPAINADYVVDASGFRSVLAQKHELRTSELQTHTRGMFTHMTGVRSFHATNTTARELGIPYSLAEGTLHHVFDGGWLWVIPFNNHPESSNDLCSVGLLLDPRIHGDVPDFSPQQEFEEFVRMYPDIAGHLEGGTAVRDWVRAGRLQYSSTQVAGDRFCLLGHAAGFIDPLFSKGLHTSLAAVLTFGRQFLQARKTKDYSRENFLDVEEQTLRYVAANDVLVANAIKSFGNASLWRVYSVIWILGAYLELVRLTGYRQSLLKHCQTLQDRLDFTPPELRLVGGGYSEFDKLATDVDKIITELDMADAAAVNAAVTTIRQRILSEKWVPYSHRAIARGATHLPKRKFSWRLFMSEGGLLGRADYKKHFFGDTNVFDLAFFMLKERLRYSRSRILAKHRLGKRNAI